MKSKYLEIERKLTLRLINTLEHLTRKPMCDTHPELERLILETNWEDVKEIRKNRLELEQVIDDLNFEMKNKKEL